MYHGDVILRDDIFNTCIWMSSLGITSVLYVAVPNVHYLSSPKNHLINKLFTGLY